ncbi:Phosphoribosylamine--glycine ligase [Nostocoides japonicum T1-X7]|uniref:Phosphoribosylamine--glycine ligase n=1 Tax=Nostocoides japonicum T1-X7 TaxID=1194083 RepID=A0A077M1G5_9MICO|nr:phosphoribosylamine--glycine ligase [Tetrasphaera japonica]CCH78055.1 Phosphoribosylamine--glycine ligase [Tetrasphaera japonica T1-X7]
MKILVIGGGAREHALVRSLSADPVVDTVIAAPGNPGIATIARCEALADLTDGAAVVAMADRFAVDLVVIGPEAPLVAGVADALRDAGHTVYGPSAAAARLEGSKAFAKDVMAAANVPTALAHVCTTEGEVEDALDAFGPPYVVKDDGLAAGKGVVVTDDRAAAIEHARACLAAKDAGRVVVEQYLDGPEVSIFCVCDGLDAVPLAPAQDFKRVGDGDVGPNTGGMGAYSPLDWAPDSLTDEVLDRIARPVLAELRHRGTPFVGTLYVGLALTSAGPRVVEFNARFGDPETQVVLARLLTPLGGLLQAAATGRLADVGSLRWSPDTAVTVVVAAENYPATPRTGDVLDGLDVSDVPTAYILHAGTAVDDDGNVVSAGGRVLSVVALGPTLAEARQRVYAAVDRTSLAGGHHRTDIALRAERGEVTVP